MFDENGQMKKSFKIILIMVAVMFILGIVASIVEKIRG